MSIALPEFQSSELSRNSAAVFAEAEKNPVLVTRRDGEDFVLMSLTEAAARKSLLEFASQLISITTDDRGSLVERMCDRFPWMFSLTEQDRYICTKEILEAARASFSTNSPNLAVIEINAWHDTAVAIASKTNNESLEVLDVAELVTRP